MRALRFFFRFRPFWGFWGTSGGRRATRTAPFERAPSITSGSGPPGPERQAKRRPPAADASTSTTENEKDENWHLVEGIISTVYCAICTYKGTKILATGGASNNKPILQVIADVFNAPVYVQEAANSAMLGSAYQAKIGLLGEKSNYEEVTSCLPQPQLACQPYTDAAEIYDAMVLRYRSVANMLTQQHS